MQPVTSSNIAAIGRDEATGVMVVNFTNGGSYQYRGVPVSVFNEFLAAESKGKFFASQIKGKYEGSRL